MKINVLFFANFKEVLAKANLTVELENDTHVADICKLLSGKGERWHSIFDKPSKSVKIAVNQEMTDLNHKLKENDEVAFFPPVTGG